MDITTCLHSPKCVRFLSSLSVQIDFCPIVCNSYQIVYQYELPLCLALTLHRLAKSYHPVSRPLSICRNVYGHVVAQPYKLMSFVMVGYSHLFTCIKSITKHLPLCITFALHLLRCVRSCYLTLIITSLITSLLLLSQILHLLSHTLCLHSPIIRTLSSSLSVRADVTDSCYYFMSRVSASRLRCLGKIHARRRFTRA